MIVLKKYHWYFRLHFNNSKGLKLSKIELIINQLQKHGLEANRSKLYYLLYLLNEILYKFKMYKESIIIIE